jgi:hypothetical protein
MLKKALGILLVFGILCIALSAAIPAFAVGPVYEIIQTYDVELEEGAFVNGAAPINERSNPNTVSTMTQIDESLALYGEGSLKVVNNNTVGTDWETVRVFKSPPAPTIASPKGFFFRMETNAVLGGNIRPIARNSMWATGWGKAFTWVSYDGTVYHNDPLVPVANFNGYVFAMLDVLAPAEFETIGYWTGGWASPGYPGTNYWGGTTTLVDNVGYYSVTDVNDPAEYLAIAQALDAEIPRNPAVLNSISTGNYNDELLADVQTTMQKNITRPGPTDVFAWSIDNPTIATIDQNGVITPKKYGTATITATLTLPDASQQIKTTLITVVKGSIYFTVEQYTGVANAVVEADGIVGIKPKLNAKVIYNGFDNRVNWSVLEGEGSVENLSDEVENASALDVHSAYITFEDSGTVVLRASLVDAPTVYRDFVFTVAANKIWLEAKIFEAEGLGGEFTITGYDRLLQAIEDGYALLEDEDATQADYNEMIDTIQFAMDNVYEEGEVSSEDPVSSTPDPGPQTSDSVNPLGYAALLTLALAGVVLGRKMVINRQRR